MIKIKKKRSLFYFSVGLVSVLLMTLAAGTGLFLVYGSSLLAPAPAQTLPTLLVLPTQTAVLPSATPQPTATALPATLTPPPSATVTLTKTPAPSETPVLYQVKAGDTLTKIANLFQVDVAEIIHANTLQGDQIKTGQVIRIPGRVSAAAQTSVPSATPQNGFDTHPGDTLASIAVARGVAVADLRAENFMIGDAFIPGQRLLGPLPGAAQAADWHYSALHVDPGSAYPLSYVQEKFTLFYAARSLTAIDPQSVAGLITRAIRNDETLFARPLSRPFKVYSAGSLFEPPNNNLRGQSFSAVRQTFILQDGTGSADDQQYIFAHELTHMYMWNTFGVPSSTLISEGTAVYAGMQAISSGPYLPLKTFCSLYLQEKTLPHMTGSLSFAGHNYDLPNYYAAGCFVQYLVETYGPEKLGILYPSGNFESVYGHPLPWLDQAWRANLAQVSAEVNLDPGVYFALGKSITGQYRLFFPSFTWSTARVNAYRELDQARVLFLQGEVDGANQALERYRSALGAKQVDDGTNVN